METDKRKLEQNSLSVWLILGARIRKDVFESVAKQRMDSRMIEPIMGAKG